MIGLADILREDVWRTLHPATRLVVKILQHIKSKIDDATEVRAYLDESEILITTYKSEIRITPTRLEFKRRSRSKLRVQRIKLSKELSKEVLDAIKTQIIDILEHDYEPDYSSLVEILEKALKPTLKAE
jgi:translation initiation factor 2 beta subunit (eIF-2beta)/eIF-5